MKRWLACLLVFVLAGAPRAWAAEPPAPASTPPPVKVRVYQDPPGAVLQGETVRIKVDMLTPSFFSDAPVLPELHVDGAYLQLSDETPGHLVDTIDGASWSGVSRTYLLTSLVSGPVEIPAFEISAHVGADHVPVQVRTTPLMLQMRRLVLPEGVSEALIARTVRVRQTVTPKETSLHVGDTVTRRIEISAEGAPAMLLPPVAFKPVDGLTLYTSPPLTQDLLDTQGGFVGGRRIDAASYAIQSRGHYTLPPVTVRWMDSRTHAWRESRLPAVKFHAWWGSPARPRFALPQQGLMPRLLEWFSSDLGIAVLALLVLAVLAWWFRDRVARVRRNWRTWRARRRHSEKVAFAAVRRQRRQGSAAVLAATVDAWVRRTAIDGGPATMEAWTARYGDAELRRQWAALQAGLYGGGAAAWSATAIVGGIARARQQWLAGRRRAAHPAALPPLNPLGPSDA